MTLEQLLIQIGVNLASSVIFEITKQVALCGGTTEELEQELAKQIKIEGANIKAQKIIRFLAERGDILISNSSIHSSHSLLYQAGSTNKFILKDNVASSTYKSHINLGQGASIVGSGNAFVHQDEDGNISFGFKE